jgi:hypothetical protein
MKSFSNMVGGILLIGIVFSYVVGGSDDDFDILSCRMRNTYQGHGDNYNRIVCGWQAVQVKLGVQ